MFISNIICKLPTIIYKLRIICKGYNSPYKQGLIVTINYYKYKFHWTLYASPSLSLAHPSSFSIFAIIHIYLLISPHSYLTWASKSFVLHVSPPVKGTLQSRCGRSGTPHSPHQPWHVQVLDLVRTINSYKHIDKFKNIKNIIWYIFFQIWSKITSKIPMDLIFTKRLP